MFSLFVDYPTLTEINLLSFFIGVDVLLIASYKGIAIKLCDQHPLFETFCLVSLLLNMYLRNLAHVHILASCAKFD